jgi:hypothetical protein
MSTVMPADTSVTFSSPQGRDKLAVCAGKPFMICTSSGHFH